MEMMKPTTSLLRLGQFVTLALMLAADALPLLTDESRSNGLFLSPADVFRNRPTWLGNEVNKNAGQFDTPLEQRPARSIHPNWAVAQNVQNARSRQCYFSPVQCTLHQQQLKGGTSSDGSSVNRGDLGLQVIRPLMNSAASRKRQTLRHNTLLLQHWRSSNDSPASRLRFL